MRQLTAIILLALTSQFALAQDTAYISQDKKTALFFPAPVSILNVPGQYCKVGQLGNGVITLQAHNRILHNPLILKVQDVNSKRVYQIPVAYSYGRAGRRITYGAPASALAPINKPLPIEQVIARRLAAGKRTGIASHAKAGSIKGWINKISMSGNQIFFRLDVRNRSDLPYDIDFVRFYIRNRKSVNRMATHEKEIIPQYDNVPKHTSITKGQDAVRVFAFRRFSLSDDEVLHAEVYERKGNRHLSLKIKAAELDRLQLIPIPQPPALKMAANHKQSFFNR